MGAKPTVDEMMRASEPPAEPIERLDRPTSGIADDHRRDPVRRPGHAAARGDRVQAQADGRDRRPADPLAHHEASTRHYGVRDFVLCLGYKGDVIRDYFLNYACA